MHFLIILALSIAGGALLYRFVRQAIPVSGVDPWWGLPCVCLDLRGAGADRNPFADVTCAGIRRKP